jgi:hypothetical protein
VAIDDWRSMMPKPILVWGTGSQNKETNQKEHSFDVRRSRRHIPAYTREPAAAMFLGSIVREFYYKQYGENRTMIIKTAPVGI